MTNEDAIKWLENLKQDIGRLRYENLWPYAQAIDGIIAMLEEQLQIVRCKDCINCVKEPNGDLYCDVLAIGYEPLGSKKVNEAWFCADGKLNDALTQGGW